MADRPNLAKIVAKLRAGPSLRFHRRPEGVTVTRGCCRLVARITRAPDAVSGGLPPFRIHVISSHEFTLEEWSKIQLAALNFAATHANQPAPAG